MTSPPSPEYIPAKYQGGRQDVIKRIVMHGTVSSTYCGGARAIANYFQNPTYESSAHYVVDPCEEFQCVYDHTIAWHDGTNTNSIGVEMCDPVEGPISRWDDEYHQKMLVRTANLVRQLCLAYEIPMRYMTLQQIRNGEKGICGHNDMRLAFPGSTSHWDPGAFPWYRFISLVNNEEEDMPTAEQIARATVNEFLDRDIYKLPFKNPDNQNLRFQYFLEFLGQQAYGARRGVNALPAIIKNSTSSPEQFAEALRPVVGEVIGPVVRQAVKNAMGADNEQQADAIVDEIVARLIQGDDTA